MPMFLRIDLHLNNISQLCFFLYSDYYLPFILAAYQLLISMFAAIIISLNVVLLWI
jgi:NADH:ubiquinone oxidoreductase subunit 6 (subunit J)